MSVYVESAVESADTVLMHWFDWLTIGGGVAVAWLGVWLSGKPSGGGAQGPIRWPR